MYTAQAYEGQRCTSNETGMDSASVTHIQGCGVGVFWVESESQQHWKSDFFVRFQMSNSTIFYITLLN